jgi:hypothetical protein
MTSRCSHTNLCTAPLWAGAVALLLTLPSVASAKGDHDRARGHEKYHAKFYSGWTTSTGASCCNDSDCSPISSERVRIVQQKLQVLIDKDWVSVPPERVRAYNAPDMNSHLCNIGKSIICFVFGGGV